MRLILALVIGKLISFVTRALRIGGGSAAPGVYALKIDPHLIKTLSSQIPKTVIITGTNGKTTTTRMLAHLADSCGYKVLRNSTGSNLERGIASALIQSAHLPGGQIKADLAIWELDEASFNNLAPVLNPQVVVFLNVLRDQLDRYGEVDSVVQKWCQTLKHLSPKVQVLINGDDQNLQLLKSCFNGKTKTFGLKSHKIKGELTAAQLKPAKLDFEAKDVSSQEFFSTKFTLNHIPYTIPVPGFYHVYDAVAALSTALLLELPTQNLALVLKNYTPAFGRFEKFTFPHQQWEAKSRGYLFLIKNPVGATQVFETISPQLKESDILLIALNDNFADGKDVSWIWDANFETLRNSSREQSRDYQIFTSGSRAQDLAVRLKYAGFDPKQLKVENNLKKALQAAQEMLKGERGGRLFILPTYTALLQIQDILVKYGFKSHYWREN